MPRGPAKLCQVSCVAIAGVNVTTGAADDVGRDFDSGGCNNRDEKQLHDFRKVQVAIFCFTED